MKLTPEMRRELALDIQALERLLISHAAPVAAAIAANQPVDPSATQALCGAVGQIHRDIHTRWFRRLHRMTREHLLVITLASTILRAAGRRPQPQPGHQVIPIIAGEPFHVVLALQLQAAAAMNDQPMAQALVHTILTHDIDFIADVLTTQTGMLVAAINGQLFIPAHRRPR